MAFTGNLEHLPIVDIIQLLHTTRKSGIFSVKGDKGESRIVFSHGYIVGANHINSSVRIGSVLVKTGAITIDDLKQAMSAAKGAARGDRRPLMLTLMQMGRLKRQDALKGLRKLIELTIVELMSWTKGTFTFDSEAAVYAPDIESASNDMEQDVGVDAQMVLMDALRIVDERERDRMNGKEVPSFEALYPDVIPGEGGEGAVAVNSGRSAITADVLGLADIERLERKIPVPVPSEMEVFDPVAIHRENIRELLAGFSSEEQEAFVSFLKKPSVRAAAHQASRALVLFSTDKLITHAIITIGKDEGVPVFAADHETALEQTVSECLSAARIPMVVFDVPARSGAGFSEERITSLRNRVREQFSTVPLLQFVSLQDCNFILRSFDDGVRAVLPKPAKEARRATYIQDTIRFLGVFKLYLKAFQEQPDIAAARYVAKLRSGTRPLRETADPADALLAVLAAVAETFERSVMFFVRPSELTGERSLGVFSDKSKGPAPAENLKIPLSIPSVFREVIEKKLPFYGEGFDSALRGLFTVIGEPLRPAVVLLPLISNQKVVAIVYGDFGKKQPGPVRLEMLKILAEQVGIVLECAFFRRQAAKAPQ